MRHITRLLLTAALGVAAQFGLATPAGAVGETISVTNPQSKRTVQATILGPGKAAASAVAGAGPAPGPFADASAARP